MGKSTKINICILELDIHISACTPLLTAQQSKVMCSRTFFCICVFCMYYAYTMRYFLFRTGKVTIHKSYMKYLCIAHRVVSQPVYLNGLLHALTLGQLILQSDIFQLRPKLHADDDK